MASLKASADLQNLIKKIVLDTYFPVGSIYLSTSKTNPGTIFGGTWKNVGGDKYLIGYSTNTWFDKPGTSTGSNGKSGSWNTDNTAISIAQLPAHSHGMNGAGGHTHQVYLNGDTNFPMIGFPGWAGSTVSMQRVLMNQSNGTGFYMHTGNPGDHTHGIHNTGSGQGHNHFHVSPYFVVVIWQRTA